MSFSLTILGCSSALPTSQRFPTAQILNISEQFYLIDCGEGTQIQIRKFCIRISKIHHIFISHLHGDHFFGLFGLISTMNLLGRKGDLHIYAPEELEKILSGILNNFERIRFKVIFKKIDCTKNEIIFENNKITVETIPLKHRIPTCGFLFKEKPKLLNIRKESISQFQLTLKEIVQIKAGNDLIRDDKCIAANQEITHPAQPQISYAYCSDTLYKEDIIPLIQNVNLLYHEATYTKEMEHRAKETYHSTAQQAAIIAKKANVKQLIIGHFSARYKNSSEILEEATSVFPDTIAAEDGLTVDIGKQ